MKKEIRCSSGDSAKLNQAKECKMCKTTLSCYENLKKQWDNLVNKEFPKRKKQAQQEIMDDFKGELTYDKKNNRFIIGNNNLKKFCRKYNVE